MSILIIAVTATAVASIQEMVAWRVRLHRISRAMPRRAKQYKFN